MDGATAPSRQAAETITSAAMRWCRFDPDQEPKHGLNLTIPRAATVYLEQRLSIDFQASDRQIFIAAAATCASYPVGSSVVAASISSGV